ncbi:MAG: SLBB domain-containing protein, partial [Odoribacter sp.]
DLTSLKQLIEKSEGIKGDAFMNRAVLYREKPDLTTELIAIDLSGLLEGKIADMPLCKNDVFYIPSIFDLKEQYNVSISGAVRSPGTYGYVDNLTIEDLILQAGGLRESASTVKIDIARRIKNPTSMTVGALLSENYTLTLKDGLIVDGKKDFTLQPFDEIFVRNSPGYKAQRSVAIEGEVLFNGQFVLSEKGERLSDLIKKAGGLTPGAYVVGARLTRRMNADEMRRVETLLKLAQTSGRDSIDRNRLNISDSYYVGIELQKALKNPGSDYDVVLREGDVLNVPEYSGTVKISGAVRYPNTVVYEKNAKLNYYIGQGGGFADRAKKRRVFIVYMNGTVGRSKTFNKANAAPGCEIIVPVRPTRKGVGLGDLMNIATSSVSMTALVTSILNNTK